MPKIDVEISDYVYIDVEEFLDSCDSSDIEDVINYIKVNKHLSINKLDDTEPKNLYDIEWENALDKLYSSRRRLSNEDEELIKSIANKL